MFHQQKVYDKIPLSLSFQCHLSLSFLPKSIFSNTRKTDMWKFSNWQTSVIPIYSEEKKDYRNKSHIYDLNASPLN